MRAKLSPMKSTPDLENIASGRGARGIELSDAPLRLDSYGDSPELCAELLTAVDGSSDSES